MQIISPKYDFSLKELLNNELVRKHFICDVLDIAVEEVYEVRLMNTFLWKRYRWQKQGILDVLVELNNSVKINIELQVATYADWDRRSMFYLAKMYTEDLRAGEDYARLKRCIHISILDFNFKKDSRYHSVYRLRDEDGNDFSDVFELHIIELQKKLNGTEKIDNWIRLLNAESEADLDMIQTKNVGIVEAIKEVKVMSLSKRMRLRYEARLKEMRDQKAREEFVKQEGRQEGRAEKTMELIKIKLAKGQSIEQIAEALEETPEYIKKIMEEI